MKWRRWCGIDNRGDNQQGGGTAAFVVVRQQLAGRGSAALVVVSVMSRRQRQCWQWFWRAHGRLQPYLLIIFMQKISAPQKCLAQVLPGALIFAPGVLFCSREHFFAPERVLLLG